MRIMCHLDLRMKFRDKPVVNELARIHPDAWKGTHGYVTLPETDPRMDRLKHVLAQAGFQPQSLQRIPVGLPLEHEYSLWYSREYDSSDLHACSYLQIEAFQSPPTVGTRRGGISWDIRATEAIEGADFVEGETDRLCCPDRVRRALEDARLGNPGFRETVPEDPDWGATKWDTYGPPWWEITTDVVMPPMSPSMILYDGYWKRVEAGDQHAMFVFDPVDPRIGKPELHYRAADLAAIEPFDIAKTFEKYRAVIVSKRFYDVCVSLGLKAKWTPVRVEQ